MWNVDRDVAAVVLMSSRMAVLSHPCPATDAAAGRVVLVVEGPEWRNMEKYGEIWEHGKDLSEGKGKH